MVADKASAKHIDTGGALVLFCFVLFVLQLSVVPQWASATTAGPFSMWGFRVTAEETRCRIAT